MQASLVSERIVFGSRSPSVRPRLHRVARDSRLRHRAAARVGAERALAQTYIDIVVGGLADSWSTAADASAR
jgi:hypothetical protein